MVTLWNHELLLSSAVHCEVQCRSTGRKGGMQKDLFQPAPTKMLHYRESKKGKT